MLQKICFLLCLLVAGKAMADDGVKKFEDFSVYYNVVNTSMLQPQMAKLYGIQRAPNRAYINISLRSHDGTQLGKPLKAKVEGQLKNSLGQVRFLEFEKIEEKDAVYYIAVIRFTDQEMLRFDIEVSPYTDFKQRSITFSRQLFEQ